MIAAVKAILSSMTLQLENDEAKGKERLRENRMRRTRQRPGACAGALDSVRLRTSRPGLGRRTSRQAPAMARIVDTTAWAMRGRYLRSLPFSTAWGLGYATSIRDDQIMQGWKTTTIAPTSFRCPIWLSLTPRWLVHSLSYADLLKHGMLKSLARAWKVGGLHQPPNYNLCRH